MTESERFALEHLAHGPAGWQALAQAFGFGGILDANPVLVLRALESQGLVEPAAPKLYRLTNEGRKMVEAFRVPHDDSER